MQSFIEIKFTSEPEYDTRLIINEIKLESQSISVIAFAGQQSTGKSTFLNTVHKKLAITIHFIIILFLQKSIII